MFDRPSGGERAILVQVALPDIDAESAIEEFSALASSAQAQIIKTILYKKSETKARHFIGTGKVEELRQLVELNEIDIVLVNHELSPSQERNLEQELKCRVIGRSGLILDIFAQRALTFEGKLQVELAQLQHMSTRLIRGWTHLERQKGGIGLRGPGEKQLETDRRLLRARIKSIHTRLEKVRLSRDQNRRARKKASMPTVSLVGYTNAGKSSLFNALTGAHIFTADKLFATLDPTMRKLDISGAHSIILADTVGFIRDLPHKLVEAFQATLEESREADLLLQVVDISDPNWREETETVDLVLEEIGANDIPRILVFNKIDKQDGWIPKVDDNENTCKVWVSAATGAGLDLLKETITTKLHGSIIEEDVILSAQQAKIHAKLHSANAIIKEEPTDEGGWRLKIRISKAKKLDIFS